MKCAQTWFQTTRNNYVGIFPFQAFLNVKRISEIAIVLWMPPSWIINCPLGKHERYNYSQWRQAGNFFSQNTRFKNSFFLLRNVSPLNCFQLLTGVEVCLVAIRKWLELSRYSQKTSILILGLWPVKETCLSQKCTILLDKPCPVGSLVFLSLRYSLLRQLGVQRRNDKGNDKNDPKKYVSFRWGRKNTSCTCGSVRATLHFWTSLCKTTEVVQSCTSFEETLFLL